MANPACRACGGATRSILWLGYHPLAEHLLPLGSGLSQSVHPLELVECSACRLVQLAQTVDPTRLFPPGHPYATGNTRALREHFAQLAQAIQAELEPGLAVDVGCNDGTLLANFPDPWRRIGVEPTDQALAARDQGISVHKTFFSPQVAEAILEEHGPAKVLTMTNVLAHLPDIHPSLEAVSLLLGAEGVLVSENHHLASEIRGLQWDSIYHEHVFYYSLRSLGALLASHGLQIFRAEHLPVHGGSFRVWAGKQTPALGPEFVAEFDGRLDTQGYAGRVAASKLGFWSLLTELKSQRPQVRIWGLGAATRASTLINYLGLDSDLLEAVCEVPGSQKLNHYMPGTRIPILAEAKLLEAQPEYALLFPWHLAYQLAPKLRAAGFGGRFLVPLPEAQILDA
jgi:C-methyltransferase C-terminal domain/Putative zinc binding domain/Methyltransferase domain